jgi:4-amino-4-deoxy-L-arabinose transferase-like glycosyltransferase
VNQFLIIWLAALAVKTVLAIWLPFSNDESYYWVWGHHPQLSYFDHPPMVGWLFWLGSWLEAFGNAARLPGVWLGHATLLIWNAILKPFLSARQLTLWLGFVLFSPFLGVGSLIVTPDVPLLFFWSLSLLIFLTLLEKPTAGLYAAFGASLGLGFCSKYMIVLFVPTAIAWILWSRKWREVKWAYVPLTIVTGLVFCAPVIYWNWQNEWASFAFQLNHGLVSKRWHNLIPVEFVAGQVGILFPIVVVLALLRREPKEARFLHFFGWLPLAFFFYTSFKAPVEANWPIMAHPAILSLAFMNATSLRWIQITAAVWIAASALLVSHVAHPWLPIDQRKLKTYEFTRFDVILPVAETEPRLFLGSYQMAADISYKQRRQIYKLGGLNRRDFYDFTPQSYPDDDRFVVVIERGHRLPDWVKEKGYSITSTQTLTGEYNILEVTRDAQTSDR